MSRSSGGGNGLSVPRIAIIAFCVAAAVFLLGSRSHGDVAADALADVQRELQRERAKHRAEVAELRQRLDAAGNPTRRTTRVKQPAPATDEPHGDHHGDGEDLPPETPKATKKPRRRPTPAPAHEGEDGSDDHAPAAHGKAASHNDGGGDEAAGATPERDANSPESNKMPEDIHHPDEKKFFHSLSEIQPVGDGAPPEAANLARVFNMYTHDREAATNVPVYGTACVGKVDCQFVRNQLKALDTGVGHVIVVQNREADEHREYFESMQKQFPGRFTFQYRPIGGGCSESWNIIMRLGFSITPTPNFVMATNGDLWALPGYLAKFSKYMNDNLEKQVGARFVHFSSFGLNKQGWEKLGAFDEVIFPAYAEDVEYHIRAVSAGLLIGSFPGMAPDRSHKHVGSPSFKDKKFNEMYQRWDKNDYMYRKWGVDMRQHTDFQRCKPYKHPWNQPTLSHRSCFVVDPKHRHCIRTGEGIKHNANRGGCMLSSCRSCWYNASVLLPLLPEGTVLPDTVMTQNRVRF